MSVELYEMEKTSSTGKLKIALVGREKNGKSRLAATARKPVVFHDFDGRKEAVAGIPGVYVLEYKDPVWPKQPEAAQDFLSNLSKLEDSLDLSLIKPNASKGTIIQTNVVDSIQTFGRAFMQYALFGSPEIRREIKIGATKAFLPKGWDGWGAEMSSVENAILRLLALPTDTIIILHEQAEEAADSTDEKPKYTGRISVFPARYQRLLKYFNEVWRVRLTQVVNGNKSVYEPRVYPLPDYEFDASTTLTLDGIENPNIEGMIEKSEKNKLQAGSQVKLPKDKPQIAGVKG